MGKRCCHVNITRQFRTSDFATKVGKMLKIKVFKIGGADGFQLGALQQLNDVIKLTENCCVVIVFHALVGTLLLGES